jgi:molybdenum cofactor guanylyltransferase
MRFVDCRSTSSYICSILFSFRSEGTVNSTLTGVILAGGKSSRMGSDKALLQLDGRPFVEHIALTLKAEFERVMLVANDPAAYAFLGLEIVGDVYQDCGPLGGIHSGLVHADGTDIFVCACDTPLVNRDVVKYIAASRSASLVCIPSFHQRLHPLCGSYKQECIPLLVEEITSQRLRVLDFVEKVHADIVPITPDLPFFRTDLFSNFNSAEDFPRRSIQ